MDTSAASFQSLGPLGCNFCSSARERLDKVFSTSPEDVARLISKIKRSRRRSRYDCVVGVSGGVDSSWLLQWAVGQGLKVLAVHMDNNWNSAQASINISRLIETLDCDLFTHVIPWTVEKQAKIAFMNADVVDIELIYDNALHKVCFDVAKQFGVRFILGGQNNASEGVEVPANWAWKKFDGVNIRSILRSAGVNYSSLPILTSLQWLRYLYFNRIAWTNILDLLPEYSKEAALELLSREFDFVPYGHKHYENVFTRFYQGHILPVKFDFDKRKPHLSSQIVIGEISRADALRYLEDPPYFSNSLLQIDREMVISKLGLTEMSLDAYLGRSARSHADFRTDRLLGSVIPALLELRRRIIATRTRFMRHISRNPSK